MGKLYTVDFSNLSKIMAADVSNLFSIYGMCIEKGVSEGFEGTGFELTGWTINEGGDPWGEIDEDYDATTVSGAPASWEAQCMEIDAINPWSEANIERAFPTSPIECHKFGIIFSMLPTFGDADLPIFVLEELGSNRFYLELTTDGGGTKIRMNNYGGIELAFNYLSTDTLYTIETRYDRMALEWEWKINGVLQPNNIDDSAPVTSPGTIHSAYWDDYHDLLRIGTDASGWITFNAYVDNWQWSSCGWIT